MSVTETSPPERDPAERARARQMYDSCPQIRRELARAGAGVALIRPRPTRHHRPA